MILRRLPLSILILLVVQFIIGTLASLYQVIPDGSAKYEVYKPAGLIFFHVLTAVVLIVLAIIFVVKAKKSQSRKLFGSSIGGLTCILLAYITGALFVETGNDILAFSMTLMALGALLSYAQIVFGQQFKNT